MKEPYVNPNSARYPLTLEEEWENFCTETGESWSFVEWCKFVEEAELELDFS